MPRYHFSTSDGREAHESDEADHVFTDDKAASDAAQEALADMAQDALPDGAAVDMNAEVEDEAGARIYEASLKFRGRTAGDIRAQDAREAADADEATDAIARALDGIEPPKAR